MLVYMRTTPCYGLTTKIAFYGRHFESPPVSPQCWGLTYPISLPENLLQNINMICVYHAVFGIIFLADMVALLRDIAEALRPSLAAISLLTPRIPIRLA